MTSSVSCTDLFCFALHPPGPFSAPASSGSGTQQVYQDRNPAAPDDPALPALSYPTGGGTVTEWDVASQTWI